MKLRVASLGLDPGLFDSESDAFFYTTQLHVKKLPGDASLRQPCFFQLYHNSLKVVADEK